MTESEVSAVAFALFKAFARQPGVRGYEARWRQMDPESREPWLREARAAIEALDDLRGVK